MIVSKDVSHCSRRGVFSGGQFFIGESASTRPRPWYPPATHGQGRQPADQKPQGTNSALSVIKSEENEGNATGITRGSTAQPAQPTIKRYQLENDLPSGQIKSSAPCHKPWSSLFSPNTQITYWSAHSMMKPTGTLTKHTTNQYNHIISMRLDLLDFT